MGVLVAEKAKKEAIPYVIVTSGHAAHSDFASPVAVYLALEELVKYSGTRGSHEFSLDSQGRSWKIPTKDEYIKREIERGKDKGRAEKEYEYMMYTHLNPLMSDADKDISSTWCMAFLKLSDIAREQNKEEE